MKARCPHGSPWFAECPWCANEFVNRPHRQLLLTFPVWRNMTEADAIAHIEREAAAIARETRLINMVNGLMQRALEN